MMSLRRAARSTHDPLAHRFFSLHLVDSGDGQALAALLASGPNAVASILGKLRELSGVDVAELLGQEPVVAPKSIPVAGGVR